MSGSVLNFDDLTISSNLKYYVGAFPAKFHVRIPITYSLTFEKSSSFFINSLFKAILEDEVERLCLDKIRSIHSCHNSSLLESVFL